ncbi:MAG TPA: hypothetical protein VF006_23450 [Longimicrobium sp.]
MPIASLIRRRAVRIIRTIGAGDDVPSAHGRRLPRMRGRAHVWGQLRARFLHVDSPHVTKGTHQVSYWRSMTAQRREDLDQRLIEHEVRLSKAREAGEQHAAFRDAWEVQQSGRADRQWYRRQLISMLAEARTEADLTGLGLSDEVIREARLGKSVHEAWTRFHPPPPMNHLAGPAERRD